MAERGRIGALGELTRSRVLVFLREPEAVFWVLVFPLVLAITLGWAFKERAVESERIGVYYGDDLAAAQSVSDRLASDTLLRVERLDERAAAEERLRHGKIAILVLAGDPPVLRYDPQRPEAELARLRVERALSGSAGRYPVQEVRDTGSRYIDWLFPGLLGMNLMGTGIWSIGFAIADMRQKKLLRRFLVTPMRRSSFLLSFILARGMFLIIEVLVLVLFAVFLLGVPFRAGPAGFIVVCMLGMLTFAALGLLVAARPRTLEGVSGLMNLVMLPMWLLSGVFFSYERFPEPAHVLIKALPLTALNDGLRALMLEGSSLAAVAPELAVQAAWTLFAFAAAIKIFRWE